MRPSTAQAAVFSRPRLTLSLSQESLGEALHRLVRRLQANHAANEAPSDRDPIIESGEQSEGLCWATPSESTGKSCRE
jgi:hypothetical protein